MHKRGGGEWQQNDIKKGEITTNSDKTVSQSVRVGVDIYRSIEGISGFKNIYGSQKVIYEVSPNHMNQLSKLIK